MSYDDARIANAVEAVEATQLYQHLGSEWARIKNEHPELTDEDVEHFGGFLKVANDFDQAYDFFAHTRDSIRSAQEAQPRSAQQPSQPVSPPRSTRHGGEPGAGFDDAIRETLAAGRKR